MVHGDGSFAVISHDYSCDTKPSRLKSQKLQSVGLCPCDICLCSSMSNPNISCWWWVFRRTFTKGAQVTVAKRPLHTGQRTFAVIKLVAGNMSWKKGPNLQVLCPWYRLNQEKHVFFLFNNNQRIYIYIHVYFSDYVYSHFSMTSISLFVCAPLVRHRGHYRWLPGEGCEPNPHVRYPHDK